MRFYIVEIYGVTSKVGEALRIDRPFIEHIVVSHRLEAAILYSKRGHFLRPITARLRGL